MRQAWQGIAGLLAIVALAGGGSVALADDGGHGGRDNGGPGNAGDRGAALAPTLFTMSKDDGNPEGVAFDKRSGQFFVSRTGTGAIFSGTLGTTALSSFIAGGAPGKGPLATGLKVRKGLLYVAGATTGKITVFNIASKQMVAQFDTRAASDGKGPFINDLDVTEDGDVYATDSFRANIYKVSAAAVKAGGTAGTVANGAVQAIPLGAPISFVDKDAQGNDAFNLNGIVAKGDDDEGDDDGGGDELIVVQSATGKLFRITFADNRANAEDRNDRNDNRRGDDDHNGNRRGDDARRGNGDRHGAKARASQAATPRIQEIPVAGGPLTGGDGLLVDRGRLLVVQGSVPAQGTSPAIPGGAVTVVKLRHGGTSGTVESRVTDPSFAGPSTIARARNLLLVVNANFGGTATATQFTVTGLARNAVGHGGGGHSGRG